MSSNDILNKVEELQEFFFKNNQKNIFFKKTQKSECAKYISENIDINVLIEKTVYVIPETNIIVFEYPIFKLFANDANFTGIVDHIINLFSYLIQHYECFEINFNLESFTISAAERYIPAIKEFCNRCLSENKNFIHYMTELRILNTPTVMDMIINIISPFIEKDITKKTTYLTKEETFHYNVEKQIQYKQI